MISCKNVSNNKPTAEDTLVYLQAVSASKIDSMKRVIWFSILKANDDSLKSFDLEELSKADSSDINCLIQNRKLIIKKWKLQDGLDLKIARGCDQGTILNYKVKIADIDAKIASNRVNHYWLYKKEYWDQFLLDENEGRK